MIPSLKLSFITNDNNPTTVSLALGSTIRFSRREFTTDRLGHLSLSPQEWDSGAVFIGMVHNGSPSQCTTLEECNDEDGAASVIGESYGSPCPRGCNVVTSADPIIAMPASENTPVLQTMPTVMVQMAVPQPGMKLLPNQQQAY
jgi:hypothetical protein